MRKRGVAAGGALALAMAPAARASDQAPDYQCSDPLFRGHWFSDHHDAGHLEKTPVAYTDLVRCKMWNYHKSCCSPSMEAPQQRAFDGRCAQVGLWAPQLSAYLAALEDLRLTDVYRNSDVVEQALFDRSLDAFRPVLRHVRSCARAVMVFVAGMICFGCNPRWYDFVWREAGGAVTAVHVLGESCIYVDQHCGAFGSSAQQLAVLIADSALAKMPSLPLPDLSMFSSRERTCDWLRSTIAMQPFRTDLPGNSVSRGRQLSLAKNDSVPKGPARNVTAPLTRLANAGPARTSPPDSIRRDPGHRTSQGPDIGCGGDGSAGASKDRSPGTMRKLSEDSAATTLSPDASPTVATRPRDALDPVRDGQQSGFEFDDAALGPA